MSNLSLYHIQAEYLQLAQQLLDSGGEVTPEIEEALAINKDNLQNKAVQYTLIMRDNENDLMILEKEINRLSALKTSREKSNEKLKETVSNAMTLYGVTEIKGENFKLSFRKSTSLKITDESKIAPFFKESVPATTKLLNADIKKALANGEAVEGAELVEKMNLQIK